MRARRWSRALPREAIHVGGAPLAVAERKLAEFGLASLHSETRRYEFEQPWFTTFPISVYWRSASGLVLYTFSWCPMLLDYGAIEGEHDQSAFENWTLDGDYRHRNFDRPEDARVVTDSDELMLITLTKESDLSFDLKPHWAMRSELARSVALARCFLHPSMDSLERGIFTEPCVIHFRDLDAEVLALRDKTRSMLASMTRDGLLMTGARLLNWARELLRRQGAPAGTKDVVDPAR
jgi:hypothetical protein